MTQYHLHTFRKIAALPALLASCALSHAAQDLYFNESLNSSDPTRYLGQSSNWFTNAERTEQFTGTLGSGYNGIVNTESVVYGTVTGTIGLSLNSLTYNISNATMNNGYMVSFGYGGMANLAEDFNLNVTLGTGTGGNPLEETIRMYGNNTFNIGGDFNIDYNRAGSGRYLVVNIKTDSTAAATSNTFRVAGDINIISRQADARVRLNTNITQFTVGGIIDMSALQWTIGAPGAGYASTASVGGLTTTGSVLGWLRSDGGVGMSTLIFTNSTRQDASVTYGYTSDTESALNITMRASNAQNGYQILRFRSGAYDATDANLGDVIIDTGRLDLGMHSEMKGNRLSISGTQAVFSATATDSGEIGTVTFDEGEWYAGKIVVDIEGELAYDKIVFNGRFDKTGSDRDMGFEFSFDAYAMREFISTGGGEFILEDVITYETGSSMAGTVLEGSASGIRWEAVFGDTSLSVSFTVPEPAAVAAILGAIALAFAAHRRRR